MRKLHSFLFLVFWLLIRVAQSQVSQSVIIDKISSKDITHPFISALFQDQKGYLWVGTISGLNKYDGYNFIKYRWHPNDTNSLSNSNITCFNQSDPDFIFIGTRDGLNIFNCSTNSFKRVLTDKTGENNRARNNITALVSDSKGEKIAGTADGVLKYDSKRNKLESVICKNEPLLAGWFIQCMCTDRLGNLWIGCKNSAAEKSGIFKYNFDSQQITEVKTENSPGYTGISEDYLGNIWVSVNDGLVSISPGNYKSTFYKAPDNFYSSIAFTHTKDNTIWQCYWSFGITAFDIDKKEFKVFRNDPDNPKSLTSNKCWALLKDDNDILWIGSDVGLQKITGKRASVEVIKRNSRNLRGSFKGNIITSVLASKAQNNIVFVGVDGEGFSIYDRLKKEARNFGPNAENKNEERFINQFIEEPNGDLYILGQNNFQKVSFSGGIPYVKSFFHYQEHYCACGVEDPMNPNKLWIGGKSEIFCYDKQSHHFTFIKNPMEITNVFYSAFVSGNYIFFGFKNGLVKIDPDTREMEKIDLPEIGNIKCALSLGGDEVILSSQFLGLVKFNSRTHKYEVIYKSKNELFSEPSYLFTYKKNIWITTNEGLTGWNQNTGEISEISTDDGLPSEILHKADVHDGYFYLGTQDGLVIINPDFQISHFITPKVDVTQFQVLSDNKTFNNFKNGSELILSEKQNSFRINFTVLDFNLPEKNRFKFKMSPIEKNWQAPAGESFLIFNSLPAGNYKFELLGANADNIWSVEPFVINIKIVPPFYKTTWFYYLGISLLLVAGLIFFYLRLRSNHLKQLMLEKIIKERTAEIQLQKAELVDSITYAERIQKAIFVGEDVLKHNLSDSFIYYKPKDKVSGDFYWIGKYKDLLIIFAGDCTGHGVPGAMLSIIGTSLLNKIVHEENIYLPGEILTRLNYLFYNQLSLNVENIRDGMDASVITVNIVNQQAYFSAAKLDIASISGNKITDLKAQRCSIGESENTEFITQSIPYEPNRLIYLFSDGVKDQYGGPKKKKLSAKRFKEILFEASILPVHEQKNYIDKVISDWKSSVPQTDDMIIIGIKF